MRQSSEDISKATKGLVVMSPALEEVAVSFTNNLVPAMWKGKSYGTLKPLGSYFRDFIARLQMLIDWHDQGAPTVFWLSGFFFMQAFTTAVKQNFARSKQLAVDELQYEWQCIEPRDTYSKPDFGAYFHGAFLEGARWDVETMLLSESKPKILVCEMPVMWIKPTHINDYNVDANDYLCPLYIEGARRGILKTSGHSSNYCFDVNLPSEKEPTHWIRRGAALLLQTDT